MTLSRDAKKQEWRKNEVSRLIEKNVLDFGIIHDVVMDVFGEAMNDFIASDKGNFLDAPSYEGFVYIIRSSSFYKIGVSNNVERRIYEIASNTPFKVDLIHTIKCCDCFALERLLHKRFAKKNFKGEWFALDDDDLKWIKSLPEEF